MEPDHSNGTFQDLFRKKVRSKIAEEDCQLSMNAFLSIGDLQKKGVYRGVTRGMTFEEMDACLNLELASNPPRNDPKLPNSSLSLNELQDWLDKEMELSRQYTSAGGDMMTTLEKMVHKSDKIENWLNKEAKNSQLKPELENEETSAKGQQNAPYPNFEAAERSLRALHETLGLAKLFPRRGGQARQDNSPAPSATGKQSAQAPGTS
ncbi:Protein of unknown function, partial [Gryllus bimaculatus]